MVRCAIKDTFILPFNSNQASIQAFTTRSKSKQPFDSNMSGITKTLTSGAKVPFLAFGTGRNFLHPIHPSSINRLFTLY
jgi:hypothetical protein